MLQNKIMQLNDGVTYADRINFPQLQKPNIYTDQPDMHKIANLMSLVE